MPTAHLDDRAVVRIAGPDAKTLLQNVVTLDMEGVDAHGSGYGALLTPQGKILLGLRAPSRRRTAMRPMSSADEAEAFAKRLSLYKLRAKVEIALAPELAVYAAVGWRGPQSGSASPTRGLPRSGRRWLAAARLCRDRCLRRRLAPPPDRARNS